MQVGDKILKFTKSGKIELNVESYITGLKGCPKTSKTSF